MSVKAPTWTTKRPVAGAASTAFKLPGSALLGADSRGGEASGTEAGGEAGPVLAGSEDTASIVAVGASGAV